MHEFVNIYQSLLADRVVGIEIDGVMMPWRGTEKRRTRYSNWTHSGRDFFSVGSSSSICSLEKRIKIISHI